jgi:hypothetical protein
MFVFVTACNDAPLCRTIVLVLRPLKHIHRFDAPLEKYMSQRRRRRRRRDLANAPRGIICQRENNFFEEE